MWDRERLLLSCVRQKEVAAMRGAELGGRLVGGQGKVAVMCRSGHGWQDELSILRKAGRGEGLVYDMSRQPPLVRQGEKAVASDVEQDRKS
jgi:hypothetical protein